jgi:hypothetical protein
MRHALLETLREGPSAARERSQARGVDGPSGRWAVLPGCCLATIALYALVALVVLPDVTPSGTSRLGALMVIGSASLVTVAVARWAPRWLRGAALLLVGFAMVAVLGGVLADRIFKGVSAGSALGVAAGSAGVALVVVGWRRLLQPITRTWLRVLAALAGTLLVAQFVLLPAGGFPPATGRP